MSIIYPLGLDIGGSIIKIVYYGPSNCNDLPDYVIRDEHLNGVQLLRDFDEIPEYIVHFVKIPINKLMDSLEFSDGINFTDEIGKNISVGLTGGGAYKYHQLLQNIPLTFEKQDEITSLIKGLNYAITNFDDEVFTFGWKDKIANYVDTSDSMFPYLLVNIGSGVGIIKVSSDSSYERVTGTSLGGATFWGLAKLLTGITNFSDVENLSDIGDNKNVDLLVEDIYGGGCTDLNLPGYVIASTFGKIGNSSVKDLNHTKPEDIIKSLLYMISDNVCQIAYLSIKNDDSIKNVYFTGSFTNVGPVLWKKLSYGIEFWSKSKIQAKFLRHEGYFGAIGSSFMK